MERWLNTLRRAKRRWSLPERSKLAATCTFRNVCIAAILFLFALYGLGLPWKGDSQQQATAPGEEVTIILNTFRRLDLLRSSIQHYSQCPVVRRIHVNWAESTEPPELSQEACCNTPITFALPLLTHNDSSLNTRFLPIADLETDAVVNLDDDITVSCDTLLHTFRTWQRHPDQLVGWFPRHVTSDPRPAALKYRTHLQTLLYDREYNVILTKGAIMHRKYLHAYSVEMPQALRDLVAERRNCEDILMQLVVSSRTASPPVFEWDVTVRDSGAGWRPLNTGISQGGAHLQTRSQCVSDFSAAFGGPPVSRSLWTHPDAWMLMIAPILEAMYQTFHSAPRQHECRCAIRQWHPPAVPLPGESPQFSP